MASGAGGTLGLVNDLSVKLQKQRKQLNALVKEVKSAADKELTWKHYAGVMCLNNTLIIVTGFMVGMLLLGIAPQEGTFTAGHITATGITVANPTAQTDVMVQSSTGSSELSIQAATSAEVELAPFDDEGAFKFEAPRGGRLALTHGRDVRMEVLTGENGTDVKFMSEQVMVAGNLKMDGQLIHTTNSSLTIRPAVDYDMILSPTGEGKMMVYGPTNVASDDPAQGGSLKVGVDGDTHTLELTRRLPEHQLLDMSGEINIGHRSHAGSLRVWGRSNVSDDLTIDGNLIINNGNMNLGSADVVCGSPVSQGDLSIGGDTVFGRFANDTLETPSTVRVLNGSLAVQVNINPITGDTTSQGTLIVEQQANFGAVGYSEVASSVYLGSKLEHTVEVFSDLTSLVNMNASGDSQLGGVDGHDVVLFGDLKQATWNDTRLFEVDGTTGNTYANVNMYVEKNSSLDNSVAIGNSLFYISHLSYDEWLDALGLLGHKETIRISLLSVLDPSLIEIWSQDPREYFHPLMTMEEDTDFQNLLSDLGLDDEAAAEDVEIAETQQNFFLAIERLVDDSHPDILTVQVPSDMDASVYFMDTLDVDGTTHLTQMEVGLCHPDDPDTPEDEFAECNGRLQACDGDGEDCSTTLRGGITVFDGYNTLMTVQPDSGDIDMAGAIDFYGDAVLQANVAMGREDATVTAEGDMLLHHTLRGHKSFTVESDATIDGDMNVAQDGSVTNTLTVLGDTYLGSHASGAKKDEVRVYGNMASVTPAGEHALLVDAASHSMHSDGRLTVLGTTELLETTTINASATVNGQAQFGASLTIEADTSILVDAVISGTSTIKQSLTIGANTTIDGDAVLGSLGTDVEAHGDLLVHSVDSLEALLHVKPDIGASVTGTMIVSDLVTFDHDVDLGSKLPARGVNVLSSSNFESPTLTSEMTVTGQLTVREPVTMNSGLETQGHVTLGLAAQEGTATAMTVTGVMQLKDDDGLTIVEILPASGDFELSGDLNIGGNMYIDGQMASPGFSAGVVITDEINEISGSDAGVTVEGVLFRDGAIEITKINEMVELIPEKGVTVEGATSKGGALVLRSDANPDMLTLTNLNHQFEMSNVTTGIDWDQYYHHSLGANEDGSPPVAHAARVSVVTASSWTEEPTTHNSHMLFDTSYQGSREERARITTEGDFILDYDENDPAKVLMDSEVGHVHIRGDVLIGDTVDYNTHGNRTMEIRSEAERSTLTLDAGGTADSAIKLKIDGGSELTIRNVNYYSEDRDYQDRPTLVINDASTDIMTLDTLGNIWVSGSTEVGDYDSVTSTAYEQLRIDDPSLPPLSHPDTMVHMQSSGATDLSATAGPSSDATIMVTSGPNQNAALRLIDPADSTSSSTFAIFNRGDAVNATLAITDGDNDLLTITDQGDVGAAQFHGDFITTSTGAQPRLLTVQSVQSAMMNVHTNIDDATVVVTAGQNNDARLVLTDPNGDPDSPAYDSKNVFAIVNVGEVTQVEWTDREDVVQTQMSILAFVNGETTNEVTGEITPNHIVALDDVGAVANLRTTGNGQFGELPVEADQGTGTAGSPGTTVPVTLTVSSSGTAIMSLAAGCEDGVGCNDATVELTSGDDANAALELSTYITEMVADQFGELTIETQVLSKIRTFNMGTPEIPSEGQLQSLWTSQNPTLRTTFETEGSDEYKVMQLVDQGEYGDLAISGNGNVVGSGQRGIQIGSNSGSQPSYLNVVSGQDANAVLLVQSEPNLSPGLTLQDTSESGSATFTILNDGSFATPRMQIVDKDRSTLLEVRTVCNDDEPNDRRCVGDLYASGDVVFGSIDTTANGWDTGDRHVRVEADQGAKLSVEAGVSDDAVLRLASGANNIARIQLGVRTNATHDDERKQDPDSGNFEIARKTENGNVLELNYMGAEMFTITDVEKSATQSVGNLAVSGDVTIGGEDLDARSLVVASMSVASLAVQSGDFADAEIAVVAGNGQLAQVTLETTSTAETEGDPDVDNVFKLSLDGSAAGDPKFKIGDTVSDLVILTDGGAVGNLEVTGNGLFGSAIPPFVDQAGVGAILPTDLSVQAPLSAMLDITGEEGADFHITAGFDAYSQFTLSARPELSGGGHTTSSYLWTNRGYALTVQDSAHTNITVLAISDQGETGKFEFAGDVTFSTIGQTEPRMQLNGQEADMPVDATVTVSSGAKAQVSVESGLSSPAELTIESGDNRASSLTLSSRTDTAVGNTIQTTYKNFAFVNDGSSATSQFQITDGANPIFTIQDISGSTLVSLPGTLDCESLVSSSRTILGDSLSSVIVLNGHLTAPTLSFDGNDDGILLNIRFEDPQASTTIIVPDESGTVMTTATAFSQLEGVDNLAAGQIDEGFGSITTSSNIMTTASIGSDGTARVESAFNAFAGITLGDESTDDIHFRGVVQNNIRFDGTGCGTVGGCAKGILFHASQAQLATNANIGTGVGKQTILKGHFDATSLLGEREIIIPDVPTGGMLHVNDNKMEVAEATNVHQVAFAAGATVGEIKSYSGYEAGSGLLSGESDIINLVNPRIKTTSTVIATVSDPGDPQLGGWVMVTAVKVSQTDGQCTIKVTNVHPTRAMVDQYQVGFVVFNP